ncbi:MAG: class I SAM-dependent methyltransferase [Planctomycetes bacterium]|nr:class I SAM-dependent methyltransferase [Planctomycetota bacterium]
MSEPSPQAPPQSVLSRRSGWMRRLHAFHKHSPFNPYWLDARHLLRSVERLAPHARGVMLDVGVGERPYGHLFTPHVQRYFGLEYPPVVFGNLNPDLWNYIHVVHGIIDVFGDGQELAVRSGSCDTVLSLEVLEHLPEPERCVAEMARVLKPGGRLLMTVPFVQPLHQLPFDFRRYTPRGLGDLLERHGLVVELLEPRGNVASATGAVLSQYFLRHWAGKERRHDGSVTMSRWRGVLTLPFIALTQVFFAVAERFAKDDALALGYTVVARKA